MGDTRTTGRVGDLPVALQGRTAVDLLQELTFRDEDLLCLVGEVKACLKQIRMLAEHRNRMTNLTPGRGVILHLERIAFELEHHPEWAEEAAFLNGLVERLRLLRTAARGPGRWEHDQEQTRKMLAQATAEDKMPFYDNPGEGGA